MLSSGFANAPISRVLVFTLVSASILASITDSKHYFYIDVVPHLWGYRQFWRLAVWQACYLNSAEVLFAALTLYQLRIIERLWGSHKFASFLLTTLPYTCLLPPLVLTLVIRPLTFNSEASNYLPAGPTAIIFALLAQFHAAIPHVYKYRIATSTTTSTSSPSIDLTLTSKTSSYFLPLQLALSQLPGSLTAAAVGWSIGKAWRWELLPGARWRIPDRVWEGRDKAARHAREERERVEGLRRRMEGEMGEASGSASRGGETLVQRVVGQFGGGSS